MRLSVNVCQCMRLSMSVNACVAQCLPMHVPLNVCQCMRLSMFVNVCVSQCLSMHASLNVCQCMRLSMFVNACVSQCLSMHASLNVCQCMRLSMSANACVCQCLSMHIRYLLIIYILYYVCTLFSIFFRQLQENASYRSSPETFVTQSLGNIVQLTVGCLCSITHLFTQLFNLVAQLSPLLFLVLGHIYITWVGVHSCLFIAILK